MEIKFTFFIISKSWVCTLKPEKTNWRPGPIILLVLGSGEGRETVFLYRLTSSSLRVLRFLSLFKALAILKLLNNASPLDTQKFETLPCWLSDSFSIHFVVCLLGPPDELNRLENNNKTNKQTNHLSPYNFARAIFLGVRNGAFPSVRCWQVTLKQMCLAREAHVKSHTVTVARWTRTKHITLKA